MYRPLVCLILFLSPAGTAAACGLPDDSTGWPEATTADYAGAQWDLLRAQVNPSAWRAMHRDGSSGNDFSHARGDFDGDGRQDMARVLLSPDGKASAVDIEFGQAGGQPCRRLRLRRTDYYGQEPAPLDGLMTFPRAARQIACSHVNEDTTALVCVAQHAATFDTRRGDALAYLGNYGAAAWYLPRQAAGAETFSTMPLLALASEAAAETLATEFPPPEQKNFTPFPSVLLDAQDAAGRYWSATLNIAFDMDDDGGLTLSDVAAPVIGKDSDEAQDRQCSAVGGGFNQRTAWFPYTALFVRGGELLSLRQADGAALALRQLSVDASGASYSGPGARDPEYLFVPCVGTHRVQTGIRLDGYLPVDARWLLRSDAGREITLQLPQPLVPFLLARYRSGAMIPVPLRAVVASVDLDQRRVVVQFQGTIGHADLRKLEYRGVLPGNAPGPQESAQRHRERTEAVLADLRGCAAPRAQAIEPCADPSRRPDPRIFLPGGRPAAPGKAPPKKSVPGKNTKPGRDRADPPPR